MPLFPRRVRTLTLTAILICGIGVSTANAGVQPFLELSWWVNGTPIGTYYPVGVYNSGLDWWDYKSSDFPNQQLSDGNGVFLDYTLAGDPDPVWNGAFPNPRENELVAGNLAVENLTANTVEIRLQVILPVLVTGSGTLVQGSAGVGLTAYPGGGVLQGPGTLEFPEFLWEALIDGSAVGNDTSLFFTPFQLDATGAGSASTNGNFGIPTQLPGGALTATIGIDINFTLTAGDQASITSNFAVIIPGPGGLLVLALGTLGLRRRRRS